MKRSTPTCCGRWSPSRFSYSLLSLLLLGAPMVAMPAADDAYLDLLDREVTKVEPGLTDTGEEGAKASEDTRRQAATPAPSRTHFEALLQKQHVGTYSFYRRLPERIREEVFLDYSAGAPMEALREKIIDRYLHP